jgi:hypothetical protein
LAQKIKELSNMRKLLLPLVLGLVFFVIPGVVRADTILVAYLSGAGEVPPTDSPGLGICVLTINDAMDTITYFEAFENLEANATASHIHAGPPDDTGPVILPFSGVPNATSGTTSGTLTAADFMPGGGLETFDDAINALLNGGCYVNIHSTMFPGGEIRGQAYPF